MGAGDRHIAHHTPDMPGGRVARTRTIGRYEEGLYHPRLPTFSVIARVLGVSMDVLWYGEEEADALSWERERGGAGTFSSGLISPRSAPRGD